MSLLSIRVEGQPQLEHKMAGLKAGLDTRRILDEGAALLFDRMRSRFLAETDPTGMKWPPSKAAQRRKLTGRGGGTLFELGKLFRSLQVYAESETSRAIGTNVTSHAGFPYGAFHNVTRQFLGFGNPDIGVMSDLIIRRIVQGLSG